MGTYEYSIYHPEQPSISKSKYNFQFFYRQPKRQQLLKRLTNQQRKECSINFQVQLEDQLGEGSFFSNKSQREADKIIIEINSKKKVQYPGRIQKRVKEKVDKIIQKGYKIIIVNEPSYKSKKVKEMALQAIVEGLYTYSVEYKQYRESQAEQKIESIDNERIEVSIFWQNVSIEDIFRRIEQES